MKNPYIVGKSIYLRHPTLEDVEGDWYEWLSDPEITKYLPERYWPNSIESQIEFFNNLAFHSCLYFFGGMHSTIISSIYSLSIS